MEQSEHSLISAAVVTDSPEKVRTESAKFKALRTVSDVDTVFSLLPDNQEQKIPVLRSIALLIPDIDPVCCKFNQQSQAGIWLTLTTDSSYKADLIEILQRIRFKMQDQQAEKWGASKPLVGQMVKVKESIDRIVQSLDRLTGGAPEAFGIPPAFQRRHRGPVDPDQRELFRFSNDRQGYYPFNSETSFFRGINTSSGFIPGSRSGRKERWRDLSATSNQSTLTF